MRGVSSALRALTEGAAIAHAYAQKLAELDLIEPVRLEAEFIDGSDVALEGLYAVRAEALRKLGGADLGALQAAGYLEWAYWQSGSLVPVADLIARKNRRLAGATAA